MTFKQIVDEIIVRLGTDNTTVRTQVANQVNLAQDDVESRENWPFLEATNSTLTTTANDPSYSLSTITDIRKILNVRVDGALLKQTSKDEVEYARPSNDPPIGTPTHWYIFANELVLYPTPGTSAWVIKIDYYKYLTDLDLTTYATVGSTDSPSDIPVQFHEVLVLGGLYLALQTQEDYSEANLIGARFEDIISRMRADLFQRGADESLVLGSVDKSRRSGRPILDPSRFP